MSERTIDADRVRAEHLDEVHQPAHWGYLLVVLIGGTILMLGLIALISAT
jgi:hypothetical protein